MSHRLFSVATILLLCPLLCFAQNTSATPEALARRYGCLECHSRDTPKTGPSFQAIRLNSKADVRDFDLSFVSVNSTGDIPQDRKSAVIVAKVGDQIRVRIFDARGNRVVDMAEAGLAADANLAGLKAKWAKNNNVLPDSRTLTA